MSSKYIDTTSLIQVIGCIFNNPTLLDFSDKYVLTEDDFPNEFHRIIFGSIYKLHELGADKITINTIEDYLSSHPKAEAVYKTNRGDEWIEKVSSVAVAETFNYYYQRVKKMTLLRMYDMYGIDVSDIYDPDNILDVKKKQKQEDILDNSTLEDIANTVDKKIDEIKIKYVDDSFGEATQAGEGIDDLIDSLLAHPEVGVPLYGNFINTITRGARLKKFYLRSAATGVGKTRSMIADACYIGCNRIFDSTTGTWNSTGVGQPVLFIGTEQDLSEIQTMMLAFLSEVNEEHILNGKYLNDEEDRVRQAAYLIKNSPIYIEELPDFSLQDVEDKIKKNIREHDVKYIFFDYIHSSMKVLEEITRRSGGVKLREDNILFMLSTKLKEICNVYGVFIMSATQLNGGYVESDTPDQNLLRGAKAIADRIDYGSILLGVSQKDIESLDEVLKKGGFPTPTIKLSVYKNRRGRYKGVYVWCKADLGCCRIDPLFVTDYNYEFIEIEDTKIMVKESAF